MDPERNKKIKETIARFLAAETPGLTPEVSEDFRRLFGNRQPFFIPLEFATKSKPRVKWTKITPEIIAVDRGQRDFYRGQLNEACSDGGNLAIKVGIESHNLVEIDFDKDEFVEPFLELNPAFRNTLRTFGRRGAGFWFYAVGAYPKEKIDLNVKGDSKDHAGEFRGLGVEVSPNVKPVVEIQQPIQWIKSKPLAPKGNPSACNFL